MSDKRYDEETGALINEPERPPHSASNWKKYLNSTKHHGHPFAYLPQIHIYVGSLGSGKSSAIYGTLQEIEAIMNPKHRGRVLYYTGSRGDRILDAYDDKAVEKYSPESKESFLTAIRGILSEVSEHATAKGRAKETKKPELKTIVKPVKSISEKVEEKVEKEEEDKVKKSGGEDIRPHHIIVLEDAVNDADIIPVSQRTESPVARLFMSLRHIPATVLVSSQKVTALPTFVRANFTHGYFFQNKSEAERRDIGKIVNFSKKEFESAMDSLDKSSFVWCDNHNRRMMRGFCQGLVH